MSLSMIGVASVIHALYKNFGVLISEANKRDENKNLKLFIY